MFAGFETDWAVPEGESLIGESLAETSAWEPLGEPPISRLRHLGHNITVELLMMSRHLASFSSTLLKKRLAGSQSFHAVLH
jgi:hypothetical protein